MLWPRPPSRCCTASAGEVESCIHARVVAKAHGVHLQSVHLQRVWTRLFIAVSLSVCLLHAGLTELHRWCRAAQRRTVEECAELTSGMPTSSSDPERQ